MSHFFLKTPLNAENCHLTLKYDVFKVKLSPDVEPFTKHLKKRGYSPNGFPLETTNELQQ